jgi:hypothetical protein
MKTWKTWVDDIPVANSKEELEFVLLLVQHAVAIFAIYVTVIMIAVYLLLLWLIRRISG